MVGTLLCVCWEIAKILYPLVVTSLEGLQWWSLIIKLNVQSNREKKKKKEKRIRIIRTTKLGNNVSAYKVGLLVRIGYTFR